MHYPLLLLPLLLRTEQVDSAEPPPFVSVGYVPEYRMGSVNFATAAESLSHLVLFSIEPQANGHLTSHLSDMDILRATGTKNKHPGLSVLVCVGGAGRSTHFPRMVASAKARKRFVKRLSNFVSKRQLDGVDLDWEAAMGAAEEKGLAQLLQELRAAMPEATLTMAAHFWQKLPTFVLEHLDRVHLMSYDNQDSSGRHSTLEASKQQVKQLQAAGVPSHKIVLGMPAYGRKMDNMGHAETYADIMRKFGPLLETADEAGGFYFNGAATAKSKTKWAHSTGLAGVMLWEVGQDTSDDTSLIKAIKAAMPTGQSAGKEEL